jgi:large subunit ribosomal protein L16
VTHARVRSNQIESARRVLARETGKSGRVWVRIFPDRPYTQKPAEVGMGKGKGEPQGYEFEVLAGRMLFEVDGIEATIAKNVLRKASAKLPVKCKVVAREH